MTGCPRRGTSIAFALLLITTSASRSYAQRQIVEDNPWFVRVGLAPVYVLPTADFLTGANAAGRPIRWSQTYTIELGRQTDGSRKWHQLYRLPAYGAGFSVASFGDVRELGEPREAYAFFSWPIFRLSDRADVTTDFSTGVSWHWRPYDGQSNPYNTVIGSGVNGRFDWSFNVHYDVTPRVSVYAGVDFIHRSNGELLQPNEGVNAIGPRVALRYNLADERREPVLVLLPQPPPFRPAWEFVIGGTGARKNVLEQFHPLTRTDFGAIDLTAALQWHFYRYGKMAGGADVTYDGATGARIDPVTNSPTRAAAGDRWALGAYGGYEHLIARFSLIAQVGYTVARGFDEPGMLHWYERYGWRYRINDRLWGTLGMRLVNGLNATQVEFGVAYRLH